ncbi:MAG TPA: dihydroorotate dehydrogenase electron transfer subunit [Methanomassiliicoccales archaeon]|nr:dihydroorotate dehydrogenase electron transfer subunit [Methanomassiliicoccales archaeon]
MSERFMVSQTTVSVVSRTEEAEGVVTLRFDWEAPAAPGQFVMVWIPGVDEVPMSLSYLGERKGITVKNVGEATEALTSMKVGDEFVVRGPYGRGYHVPKGRILVVGGGTGMASLLPAMERVATDQVDTAIGARNVKELLFEERASRTSSLVRVSTDDGTKGFDGNAVQLAKVMMEERNYDMVLACGPEKMLYFLHQLCLEKNIPCQMSLERYMKCGAGLCGSCALDGMRVCKEGPVFSGEELKGLKEFGKQRRDECGRRVRL